MLRDRTCGELSSSDVGRDVTLCGWVSRVRNLGSLCFVDLRDTYGITQLNVDPSYFDGHRLHSEDCIRVRGKVALRSAPNRDIPTGEIEIAVSSYEVLSASKQPPFIIADRTDALEDTRLRWRYLDLRRPVLQRNLKVRDKVLVAARNYLHSNAFTEIQTPTLIRSTPEGARDYLVPSRLHHGRFYALPQSPQLYKQLLMVAGMDRYFQIARSYRDEDQRADRQPEFDQIDVEMSFCERDDLIELAEGLVRAIFREARGIELPEFKRVRYTEAMERYGTDKPDLRYGLTISDVSFLSEAGFKAFEGLSVKAIVIPGKAQETSRKRMAVDEGESAKFGVPHLMHLKRESGAWTGSALKNFSSDSLARLSSELVGQDGDLAILAASSDWRKACTALGALRGIYAQELGLVNPDAFAPCFIVDWPLFEKTDEGLTAMSNPFTSPVPSDVEKLWSDPESVLSTSFDTVLNGQELSSGAVRIHDKRTQWRVFEILGLTDRDIQERFGFFVEAFDYGFPPEGGFGMGIERLMMELLGESNIRNVVAFPKNVSGVEPMSQAPGEVPQESLDVLGLKLAETDGRE